MRYVCDATWHRPTREQAAQYAAAVIHLSNGAPPHLFLETTRDFDSCVAGFKDRPVLVKSAEYDDSPADCEWYALSGEVWAVSLDDAAEDDFEQRLSRASQRRRASLAGRPAAVPEQRRTPSGPGRPGPRLLRRPRDGEECAAEWLRWMGFTDAQCTAGGKDGGIDVAGSGVIAQVKMEARTSARPQLQRLSGAAMGHPGAVTAFFSLSGYTADAVQWAAQVGMALFAFDLQGEPVAVNDTASQLWARGGHQSSDAADVYGVDDQAVDDDDGDLDGEDDIYDSLADLPLHYVLEPAVEHDHLDPNWVQLDWALDDDGEPVGHVAAAESWPQDPAERRWLDAGQDEALVAALEYRLRLTPRPIVQFGSGLSGVGWAWVAMEVPAPAAFRLFVVKAAPTGPDGSLDVHRHGMDPPVVAYCTSLEGVLAATRPWRRASTRTDGLVLVVSADEASATGYRVAHDDVRPLPLVDGHRAAIDGIFTDGAVRLRSTFTHMFG